MNFQRCDFIKFCRWRPQCRIKSYKLSQDENSLNTLCKYLNISENVAQHLILKQPVLNKLEGKQIIKIIDTVHDLGFAKEVLLEEPQLFGVLPVTLKYRFQVFTECGITNVTPDLIKSYLQIIKQKRISDLKKTGLIPSSVNIENRLAKYMTQWPTSLTSSIWEDVNELSLFTIRLRIIQRYLELVLDLTHEEFYRGLETYPTVKHRPLQAINESLTILQSQIMMPTSKIKTNIYLVHADPENLKNILYKLQYIGGIDIKEVIRLHPKIAMKNYETLVEIRSILKNYDISDEAQRRCFDIYTLSSNTIKERLEKAKSIPEFNTFYHHPRFLKMIHYNNTAMKRLKKLYSTNKKCLSLNILSGCSAHYETFEKAPGDRLGKGKDLIFCISQALGKKYKSNDIRYVIKRHPFWINVPLVQVKYVYQKLSDEFTPDDIYENCPILLYPWSKIKETLFIFKQSKQIPIILENIDMSKLNSSQKLSLVLYALEKKHYFTGNGVWVEEKNIIR